jgi:predicted nucleic acid-binding protein
MLVLDANILIRAVPGRRVRELLERYAVRGVRFLAPEAAFEEASKYLPMLLEKRGIPRDAVLASLSELRAIVEAVEADFYRSFEQQARQRLRGRDEADWPILATALGLGCGLWTETRTSLALESLCGRPTELRFFSNKSRALRVQRGQSCPSCRYRYLVGDEDPWTHHQRQNGSPRTNNRIGGMIIFRDPRTSVDLKLGGKLTLAPPDACPSNAPPRPQY